MSKYIYTLSSDSEQQQILSPCTLFFPDNVGTVRVRYFAVRCRTLTSLYDENKLYVSYVQPKFTKVSTAYWNCLPYTVC